MRIGRDINIRRAFYALFGEDLVQCPKSGPNQRRTLCKFHLERNPSLDVSLEKNVFRCRSCGASGGVLDAVILAGRAETRSEAARWLKAHGAL